MLLFLITLVLSPVVVGSALSGAVGRGAGGGGMVAALGGGCRATAEGRSIAQRDHRARYRGHLGRGADLLGYRTCFGRRSTMMVCARGAAAGTGPDQRNSTLPKEQRSEPTESSSNSNDVVSSLNALGSGALRSAAAVFSRAWQGLSSGRQAASSGGGGGGRRDHRDKLRPSQS